MTGTPSRYMIIYARVPNHRIIYSDILFSPIDRYFHSLLPEVRLLRAPGIAGNLGPRHQQREPYVDWDSETFPEGKVRSITVACEWRDQGWGYRKGHFVLQLMRGQSEVVAEEHRADQLLGIAPHERCNASVTLWPDNPVVSMVMYCQQ